MKLSRSEQVLLAAVVAAVILLVVIIPGTRGSAVPEVLGSVEGIAWNPEYPAGHQHLARPADIGSVLWGPHPIYCDPDGPGKYRDPLIARGWADWISNPPSEDTI